MLDSITTNALDNCRAVGDDIFATHRDISDCSLYEKFASFEPVPVQALVADRNGLVDVQKMKFKALQNIHTNQVLDVLPFNPDSYGLEPHHTLMNDQAKRLMASGLRDKLGNVEVIDRIYEQGLRVHRTIHFHDLVHTTRTRTGQEDLTRCRMDIFNSVDKTWTFQVFSGAYRDLCRNTLVFGGEKAYHQKMKHTKNIATGAIIEKGIMGISMWDGQKDVMDMYREQRMTEKQFNDVLIDSGMIDKAGKVADNNDELKVNQKKLATLLDLYSKETRELGETMWAAFNALTHWSTHLPNANKGGRDENKRFNNAAAVRGLITSKAWTDFGKVAA